MSDIADTFRKRADNLNRIKSGEVDLEKLKTYYKNNIADFITDWGCTIDYSSANRDTPAMIPFILMPRQVELVNTIIRVWHNEENLLVEKSRQSGASWLSVAFAVTACLFNPDTKIGFGSRKEEYVDKRGDSKSLLEKARIFLSLLPECFRGNYIEKHMQIKLENGSIIIGESGANIGRGDTTSLYFIDEALSCDTNVLTPTGWVTMGSLNVGDKVIGSNGKETNIIGINNAGIYPIYKFTFKDGTSIKSSPNHKWLVNKNYGTKEIKVMRSKDIAKEYKKTFNCGQIKYFYSIPTVKPIEFIPLGELILHPYLIGALIGNGCLSKSSIGFTSADIETVERIRNCLPLNHNIIYTYKYGYRITHINGRGGRKNNTDLVLLDELENLNMRGGLSHNKFIPNIYMFSSIDERMELLRGLLDTDGSCSNGSITYSTCSEMLGYQVVDLVRSLGGMATIRTAPDHRGYRDMYVIYIRMPDGVIPYHLPRKISQMVTRRNRFNKTIINVELLSPDEVKCITVDADDHLFVAEGYNLTMNSAFLEQPQLTEASLSQGTRSRIDISTPNGTANPFYEKKVSGRVEVFSFHWRDDTRKNEEWYKQQCAKLDPITIAQELDINYSASIDGVVIPSAWVQCAIDAHIKLDIEPSGMRFMSLDVADEGKDLNAIAGRHGIILEYIEQWSGKDSDLLNTAIRAVASCDEYGSDIITYDADGIGASIKGFVRGINDNRIDASQIHTSPFHGGSSVINPNAMVTEKWNNKDFFANYKAQSWWALRKRFEITYQAITNGIEYEPENIISISSSVPYISRLIAELSQPTYSRNISGKMLIDKKPDGTKSPNLADAVMMLYSPKNELVILY